jgi:hypothetical protein
MVRLVTVCVICPNTFEQPEPHVSGEWQVPTCIPLVRLHARQPNIQYRLACSCVCVSHGASQCDQLRTQVPLPEFLQVGVAGNRLTFCTVATVTRGTRHEFSSVLVGPAHRLVCLFASQSGKVLPI